MATAASAATTPASVGRDSVAANPYAASISAIARPKPDPAMRTTSQRREARMTIGRSIADVHWEYRSGSNSLPARAADHPDVYLSA
jgi:hypothetical protein